MSLSNTGAAWLNVSDRLTVVLTKAQAHGVKISVCEFQGKDLAQDIADVRATLQALDGALARCEEQARAEVPRSKQLSLETGA